MRNFFNTFNRIKNVTSFQQLVSACFQNDLNAVCWKRTLKGDFKEIIEKVALMGNITELEPEDLIQLTLSEQGNLAREILLNDLNLLKVHGAAPVLNVITHYETDEVFPFFPTDVYSYHVDRSPIPTDTFLCTYYGAPSEILLNEEAEQKILVPEIRRELRKLYNGDDNGFEVFLTEHFFDLHYQAKSNGQPIKLGIGHLWRLATDYPGSPVLPCVHRAPQEKNGEKRLLLIC
jgi:hypothetical protein